MATHVVVSGTGTYFVAGLLFKPGVTPCDDESVLNAVRADGFDWTTVEDLPISTVEVSSTPAEEEVKDAVDKDDATTPVEGVIPNDVLLAKVDQKVVDKHVADQHTGKLSRSDLQKSGFSCSYCDKVLQSSAGKATHERVKHPEKS